MEGVEPRARIGTDAQIPAFQPCRGVTLPKSIREHLSQEMAARSKLNNAVGFRTRLLKPGLQPCVFYLMLRIVLQCVVNNANPAFIFHQSYTSSPLHKLV